jgi:hypothetical protein
MFSKDKHVLELYRPNHAHFVRVLHRSKPGCFDAVVLGRLGNTFLLGLGVNGRC